MANIDRIVNVQISLRTAAIAQQNFSELMLLGPFNSPDDEKVIIIRGADELVSDFGVQTTSPLYIAALVAFGQIPTVPHIYIGNYDATEDPIDNMIAIAGENSNWYAFVDTAHNDENALDFAAWAEGNEKIFLTCMNDPATGSPAAGDTTSVAARLKIGNFFRTGWYYHPDPRQFPEVAICVRSFTKYPGAETWANQRLSFTTYTPLSETRARNIFDKNGNTFEAFRNIAITQNGKVAGGEWIDVIRFRDWLAEEIKIRVFSQMVDNRIPYTDFGIAIIRTRLAQALDFGVFRGGIAPVEVNEDGDIIPSYTIDVPLSASVSFNNKANRLLQDVYFTARLAGAIHAVEIKGVLTYESVPVGEMIM